MRTVAPANRVISRKAFDKLIVRNSAKPLAQSTEWSSLVRCLVVGRKLTKGSAALFQYLYRQDPTVALVNRSRPASRWARSIPTAAAVVSCCRHRSAALAAYAERNRQPRVPSHRQLAAMGVSTLSEGWVDRGFDVLASAARDAGLDAIERPDQPMEIPRACPSGAVVPCSRMRAPGMAGSARVADGSITA